MKKVLGIIVLAALAFGGFAYYQSTVKPTDVTIATDTPMETPTTTGTTTSTNEQGTSYSVVPGSVIGWKGTKAGGFHTGTINVTDGSMNIESGTLIGGQFTIDMTSIKLLDITDADFENKLKNDFFQANQFATSTLVITSVTQSGSTTTINADLTIKNITQAISFPAQITANADGTLTMTSQFAIDRSKRNLDMRKGMVNDFIEYDIDLTFAPAL